MSDHADVIREWIQKGAHDGWNGHHPACSTKETEGCDCYHRKYAPALAALDALVAKIARLESRGIEDLRTLEAAEAERDALVAERDRLVAERQRLTDETDKGVRALWDEKNKFMEALEVEMAEKKALIAERERLRDWVTCEDAYTWVRITPDGLRALADAVEKYGLPQFEGRLAKEDTDE